MKKNLMSVVILALLIVNVVLSAIMIFSVTSTNKKTATLVNNIATAIQLELGTNESAEEVIEVPTEHRDVYPIEEQLQIPLAKGEDDKMHFALVNVGLTMNKKDKAYKKLQPLVAQNESLIKEQVHSVYGKYTIDNVQENKDKIEQEVLQRIQTLFDGSTFIYQVQLTEVYQ